jgi:tetratricopeptide (TPR) repeat protein
VAEGHELGNLTMTHPMMLGRKTQEEFLKEVDSCHDALVAATGNVPVLFRPPGGSCSNEQRQFLAAHKNYRTVLWSIDPQDWKRPRAEKIIAHVLGSAEKGRIILLHSNMEPTLQALPATLSGLMAKGLKVVTVSTLLAAETKVASRLAPGIDHMTEEIKSQPYAQAAVPSNALSIESCEAAIKANPNDGTAHYNLATIYIGLGKRDEARVHYRQAMECGAKPNSLMEKALK